MRPETGPRYLFKSNMCTDNCKHRHSGQVKFILAGKDSLVVLWKGILDNSVIFISTEKDTDGGVFFGGFLFTIVVVHIHLQLAKMFMVKLFRLDFDKDKTAEKSIVKN